MRSFASLHSAHRGNTIRLQEWQLAISFATRAAWQDKEGGKPQDRSLESPPSTRPPVPAACCTAAFHGLCSLDKRKMAIARATSSAWARLASGPRFAGFGLLALTLVACTSRTDAQAVCSVVEGQYASPGRCVMLWPQRSRPHAASLTVACFRPFALAKPWLTF